MAMPLREPESDAQPGRSFETVDELTAGRFAMATMLSAKALRLYAERGLLVPRRTDPANGYRLYGADQVRDGWLIALLRSADLSLDEIEEIVHAPADQAIAALDRAAERSRHRSAGNQSVLERARTHLRGDHDMSEPTTRLEQDRAVLSVLRRMRPDAMDAVVPEQTSRLRRIAADAALEITGPAFGIFHAPITDDSDGPLEIVLPVGSLIDSPEADVRSYRLAGGRLAERHAAGEETYFPQILGLYDEMHDWVSTGGRTPTGPPREIWHNSPHDAEPLRLTIAWPYA